MTKQLFIGASVVLTLILAGCKEEDKYTLRFSHTLHVKENGIDCADCHGEITDGRLARPGHSACIDCHDAVTKTNDVSAATCGMCHKEKNLQTLASAYARPAAASTGLFQHTPALKSKCADCHESMLVGNLDHVPAMTRSEAIRIRKKSHEGTNSCAMCHADMSPLVAPPNHRKDWTRRHGGEALDADAVCSVCHQAETCRACHQVNKPSSHNTLWRMKTHGVAASRDRARCQVCHEEDTCVACHSEMRPRSHNASWKTQHCDQCHSSQSRGTGCEMCHPGGIDAHPNPHDPGWKKRHCGICHSGSAEGRQCDLCHPNPVENHPDPHGSGWQDRHCNDCHGETSDGAQCSICHEGASGHVDPHAAGWREEHCQACHFGTPEANECVVCHGSMAGGHPDPHGAGWQAQHCSKCHDGTPEGDQCGTCHGSFTHSNPHPSNWVTIHCASCHTTASSGCDACHTGGGLAAIHNSAWSPDTHSGFDDQTDCFSCHVSGAWLRARRIKQQELPGKFRNRDVPERFRNRSVPDRLRNLPDKFSR